MKPKGSNFKFFIDYPIGFLFFLLLPIIFSCKQENKHIKISQIIVDSFEVRGEFRNFNDYIIKYYYDTILDQCFLNFFNKKKSSGIDIYNVSEKKPMSRVVLNKINDDIINFKAYSYNGYYLLGKTGSIFKMNGNNLFKYRLDSSSLCLDTVLLFPMPYQPFEIFDSSFLCYWSGKGNITIYENYLQYYSGGRDLVLKIKGNKIILKKVIGPFPKNVLRFTYYNPKQFRTINKKRIIYSSNFCSDIMISDIDGNVRILARESKFFHPPAIFDKSKYFDFNYISQYTIENDWYFGLYYIPKSNQYLRIILRRMDYKNKKEGTINKPLDRPWIVEILNGKFDFVKAIYFAPGIYDYRTFIPTQDGFLVMKRQYADYNSKCYKYYVCKLP